MAVSEAGGHTRFNLMTFTKKVRDGLTVSLLDAVAVALRSLEVLQSRWKLTAKPERPS